MHSSGYVHQDVKPGNILMDRGGRVLLADFGIGHSMMSADLAVGSPGYQAPEVLDDSYGDESHAVLSPPKEDVWALGVTLYQLLFRKLPFAGENLYEIVRMIQEEPLAIPEGTDSAIADLLQGMLAVKQSERFTINDILEYSLIKNAPSRAIELPPVTPVLSREGEIRIVSAVVCGEDFSFAGLPQRHRASIHEALNGIDRKKRESGDNLVRKITVQPSDGTVRSGIIRSRWVE
jgi:serine/threonine protein kinase